MFSIDAMKALAIILVTNSHMSKLYPIPELATGGLLGNTLFFFCSGFVITLGMQERPEPFLSWYWRRLKRVYAQLWIVTVILLVAGVVAVDGAADLLQAFLVPGRYWFLPAIAALYPLCYFVISMRSFHFNRGILAGAALSYSVLYLFVVDFAAWDAENHVVLKSIFYFAVMVVSIQLAQQSVQKLRNSNGAILLGAVTLAFFGYLIFLKLTSLYQLQFGAQVLALVWALCLFRTCRHPSVENWLTTHLGNPIKALSKLTLQIYLVQVAVVESSIVDSVSFPFNIPVFTIVVVGLAWLLNKVSGILLSLPQKRSAVHSSRSKENTFYLRPRP